MLGIGAGLIAAELPAAARVGGRTGPYARREMHSIRNLYEPARATTWILYGCRGYLHALCRLAERQAEKWPCTAPQFRPVEGESGPMPDIMYLAVGALFLCGCVLYAVACENL